VLVEIKSVERLNPAHAKQLLTCLRLTKQPFGLLINFGGATLKEGFKRLVNDYDPSASLREQESRFRQPDVSSCLRVKPNLLV
jgi:iron complex transport system substrate-binding protein